MKNKCCVLYSGGSDSTLVAFIAAKRHSAVHLLTFKHLGMKNVQKSTKNVSLLKNRFGKEKFIHQVININRLYNKIYSRKHFRNILKYKFHLLYHICGACKYSMHISTLIYCLKNKIGSVYDGANIERQREDPTQMPTLLPLIKKLYNHYNIRFKNVVYSNKDNSSSDKILFNKGLFNDANVKKDNKKTQNIQPFCFNRCLQALFINKAVENPDKKFFLDTEKIILSFYEHQLDYYIEYINQNSL